MKKQPVKPVLTDRYGRPIILTEAQLKALINELTNLIKP